MVRNVKCQLVKSSKHKHENVVKLDRVSVCVCVRVCLWLWPGICRSGGCLQRTEVRPQEILPHAWCAPTASLTGERDECVKRPHVSTSGVMITAEPLWFLAAAMVAWAERWCFYHSRLQKPTHWPTAGHHLTFTPQEKRFDLELGWWLKCNKSYGPSQ